MPLTHGNAWSVYFRDPEFNGVEVFIDTPWHVRQPQGEPLDLDKSNDEIVEMTRARFSAEPGFGPIDDFYRRRAEHLAAALSRPRDRGARCATACSTRSR